MTLNPTFTTDDMRVCHVRIMGRVQGVYYRSSLQQQAQAMGILGWCRNMPDGSVEALLSGSKEAVDALIQWCHLGPPNAQVERVEVTPQNQVSDSLANTFEIRR